jgi:hypothetical protein
MEPSRRVGRWDVVRPYGGGPYRCPCCYYLTLPERGGYDICPVCYWEDDGQDDHDAAEVRGGPNGDLSLTAARANFKQFRASSIERLDHVRGPLRGERPPRRFEQKQGA